MTIPTNTLPVADRSASRVINQKAIIDMIYSTDEISKAQLAKELSISKPAVSSNVADLISIGLVEEIGEGEATKSGGRKPMMLRFNENYSYIGALDVSLQEPVCAVSDLKYNLVGTRKIHIEATASAEDKRQCVLDTFTRILAPMHLSPGDLGIIVISQPGIIKEETNEYFSNERHHIWTEIGLKEYLQNELDIPVLVRNDVNMAAMGELHFGLEDRVSDLFYVSCGVGLGAGIVINGKLHEGLNGAAGEIGALQTNDGRRSENVIAIGGLIEKVASILDDFGGHEEINFQYIVKQAKANNSIVNTVIFETGVALGRTIHNCCAVLDIPTVVFGGEYLELGQALFDGMDKALERTSVIHPKVRPSLLRQTAGIYGCFVIGKEKIIEGLIR